MERPAEYLVSVGLHLFEPASILSLQAIATGTKKEPLGPPLAQLPQQPPPPQAPLVGFHEQAKTVPLAPVLGGVLSGKLALAAQRPGKVPSWSIGAWDCLVGCVH